MTIDTREKKRSHLFQGVQPFAITRAKLDTGDYAITGHEDLACVELKRLSDFDSFMGSERNSKTIPKLERMSEMLWSALVINRAPGRVFGERTHGNMTRENARGFLKMCRVRYGIHVFISANRKECERYILDHLTYVYKGLTL